MIFLGEIFCLALVINVALMVGLWFIQKRYQNAGIVDYGWAWGIVVANVCWWMSLGDVGGKVLAIVVMILIWAIRLNWLILKRLSHDKKEDKRYSDLRQYWGNKAEKNFLLVFVAEAVLSTILSLPAAIAGWNADSSWSMWQFIGMAIWSVGLIGEMLSDRQKQLFRKKSTDYSQVCNVGLWKYSRHPNYFFEFILWVGVAVFVSDSAFGWVAWICPMIMLYLLLFVTGIPASERISLEMKGEPYRDYQKKTSPFLPLPQRN